MTAKTGKTEKMMGQQVRVQVSLVDDIDGSEAAETVRFGLDGTHYEIDLNTAHAAALRATLTRYAGAGRTRGKAPRTGLDHTEIRSWAREQGLEVGERGRVRGEIVARYQAARKGGAAVTAVADLLESAARDLSDASASPDPGGRYVHAHMAALRAAAALVAVRGTGGLPRRAPLRSVWELLASTVPEFAGQARVFAAGSLKREAAGAGLPHAVTSQEADVLLREARVLLDAAQAATGEPS